MGHDGTHWNLRASTCGPGHQRPSLALWTPVLIRPGNGGLLSSKIVLLFLLALSTCSRSTLTAKSRTCQEMHGVSTLLKSTTTTTLRLSRWVHAFAVERCLFLAPSGGRDPWPMATAPAILAEHNKLRGRNSFEGSKLSSGCVPRRPRPRKNGQKRNANDNSFSLAA